MFKAKVFSVEMEGINMGDGFLIETVVKEVDDLLFFSLQFCMLLVSSSSKLITYLSVFYSPKFLVPVKADFL